MSAMSNEYDRLWLLCIDAASMQQPRTVVLNYAEAHDENMFMLIGALSQMSNDELLVDVISAWLIVKVEQGG